jgi:hypothetical protein
LPLEHIVDAGDATRKLVGRIKDRGIAVGDLGGAGENFRWDRNACCGDRVNRVEKLDGLFCPNGPVTQYPSDNPC